MGVDRRDPNATGSGASYSVRNDAITKLRDGRSCEAHQKNPGGRNRFVDEIGNPLTGDGGLPCTRPSDHELGGQWDLRESPRAAQGPSRARSHSRNSKCWPPRSSHHLTNRTPKIKPHDPKGIGTGERFDKPTSILQVIARAVEHQGPGPFPDGHDGGARRPRYSFGTRRRKVRLGDSLSEQEGISCERTPHSLVE